MSLDMNDAEPQKSGELIPDGTFAKITMTIRPGGTDGQSEIDRGLLKASNAPGSDVLMLAPGATGVRAYGAIYDAEAMIEGVAAQTDIYSKMYTTQDPGELFLMNQSSPLPIPLYPNRTLKARVLV